MNSSEMFMWAGAVAGQPHCGGSSPAAAWLQEWRELADSGQWRIAEGGAACMLQQDVSVKSAGLTCAARGIDQACPGVLVHGRC